MKYYYKFQIPSMPDGSCATYSPGWCGTMSKCPQNMVALAYNDKERFGIATAEDEFVPPEVEVITEEEANQIIAALDVEDAEVFTGEKLLHRWDAVPEEPVQDDGLPKELSPDGTEL